MLMPTDGGDFVKLTDNVALMLFDNCDLIDEEPTPAEGKCTLGLQCYDEQAHTVILNSIAEVESSEPVNLLDVGPLTWTDSGYLVYISAMELEDGKSYKLEGVFGSNATPYSVTATAYDYAKAASDDLESAGVTNEALTAEIEAARGIILLDADVVTDEEAYQNQGSGYMAVRVINHGVEGEGDMYDYNASSLTLNLGYSAAGDAYPFVLTSITEA